MRRGPAAKRRKRRVSRSPHFTAAPQQAAQSTSQSGQPSQLVPQSAHGVAQQLAVAVAVGLAAQQACCVGAVGAVTAAPQHREQSTSHCGQPSHPSAHAAHGLAQQPGATRVAAV
jgi:hypothetical protein